MTYKTHLVGGAVAAMLLTLAASESGTWTQALYNAGVFRSVDRLTTWQPCTGYRPREKE